MNPTKRILCVTSCTDGASWRSQHELAAALRTADRDVRFLVDESTSGSSFATKVRRRLAADQQWVEHEGIRHRFTRSTANIGSILGSWRPDVVVASSMARSSWRELRAECRRKGLTTVLYVREATAIGHLTAGLHPDGLVANSGSLVDEAARLGFHANLIPALSQIEPMARASTHDVLLMINPVPSRGLEVISQLATARPDIPMVLQETWSLGGRDRYRALRLAREYPNVVFRPFEPRPGRLFRDARVLLVPHRVDCQPRTVAEAHINGIPVLASDQPGLIESVGPGGEIVGAGSGVAGWTAALGSVWDDTRRWHDLSVAARRYAARPEANPDEIARRFCGFLDSMTGIDRLAETSIVDR